MSVFSILIITCLRFKRLGFHKYPSLSNGASHSGPTVNYESKVENDPAFLRLCYPTRIVVQQAENKYLWVPGKCTSDSRSRVSCAEWGMSLVACGNSLYRNDKTSFVPTSETLFFR